MGKEKRNKLEGEKAKERKRVPGGLSRMTGLWKLTFLASGNEG